ncbi:hypothetical protein EOJ36_09395 [Sandaracinomonas limnophila]|uniref:DUF3052 family protein n=1 Tax=Sandaracinomonas limnophila TaxID=1862386 RepID=A0A437PPE2_9BACT|nr:hypothetical protein [Sandaracinomonas limnophila]RVU24131.1 hypothetical protein EOJ36_09395 [Sandaracinomonas limnophila]
MLETIKKLKFRSQGIVLNAPKIMEEEFLKLGFKTQFEDSKSENTLVFLSSKSDFISFLEEDLSQIEFDSVLWFAYPKGTSKIKTDINRDILRVTGEEFGITTVTAISIDETWSALRFRPIAQVGK